MFSNSLRHLVKKTSLELQDATRSNNDPLPAGYYGSKYYFVI